MCCLLYKEYWTAVKPQVSCDLLRKINEVFFTLQAILYWAIQLKKRQCWGAMPGLQVFSIIKYIKHYPVLCRWSSISQATQSPARYRCHHVTRGMCISQWHSCSCCIWSTWWSAGTAQHVRSWIPRCMLQVSWKQWGLCVRLNPLSGGKHSAITTCAASDRLCVHSVEVTRTQPHRCTMNV